MRLKLLVVALPVSALLACADTGGDPWRDDVLAASRLDGISADQRQALEDGSISRDEYEAAVTEVVECAGRGGAAAVATRSSRGIFSFEVESEDPTLLAVFEKCNSPSTNPVNYYFPNILANPAKEDYDSLVRDCFITRELVDDVGREMVALVDSAVAVDESRAVECLEEPRAFID